MLRASQILLLVLTANASMPPAVEIPPVDENQVRPGQESRSADRRTNHQVSYSHATTSYQQNQQQPFAGYASAHLSREQVTAVQQTERRPVILDRRTECQDPMLRTFFKYCHAPGAAPQSPVQCEPIPGQTNFRCFIKQQTWPVVRITECPPGTASSNGDCVRIPGSFSTTGVMIVPVPGQQRTSQRSSVFSRQCSNGACQTCIGDQCSTTGIETPVSIDHRGRANSTTEVAAFGDAGREVKQKCSGRFCKTCIDRICYDRSYPLLRVTAGCPPAVCDNDCQDFVYWTDQCPICRCQGFATREPCRSQRECPAGALCRNHVCTYGPLPNEHFDKVCTFSSQCPSDQLCYNWRCGAKPARSRHLNQSCATDGDCPSGHICADMTCWQGDAARLKGQFCTLDHQCPTGYFCTNGTCTDVYHHGSFGSFDSDEITIAPTTDRRCESDRQCYSHEKCWERRCVTVDEYRWMTDARRLQQSQHQGWMPQTTPISPARSPATPSPDDEYQRRMAEYNRQLAEQQRQHEERQRQVEAERRRQEEAEAQRRRQEEEETERRRQQQENDRRRQEQEDERRRQDQEKLRIRQQQEETLRRQQEQEEARRRETEAQNRLREQQEREETARRRQEQEAEAARRRQEQEEEAIRRQNQEAENERRRQEQEAEEVRRRQQQEAEEARRRQEQEIEDARRRQEQVESGTVGGAPEEEDHGQQGSSDPGPDVEVGETVDVGPYDEDEEYERRMQEYNRQLRERQRQLQAENEDESEPSDQGTTPSIENATQPSVEDPVHDEDDFYGMTRQTGRLADRNQSVSSYRVRYHRVRRRH